MLAEDGRVHQLRCISLSASLINFVSTKLVSPNYERVVIRALVRDKITELVVGTDRSITRMVCKTLALDFLVAGVETAVVTSSVNIDGSDENPTESRRTFDFVGGAFVIDNVTVGVVVAVGATYANLQNLERCASK